MSVCLLHADITNAILLQESPRQFQFPAHTAVGAAVNAFVLHAGKHVFAMENQIKDVPGRHPDGMRLEAIASVCALVYTATCADQQCIPNGYATAHLPTFRTHGLPLLGRQHLHHCADANTENQTEGFCIGIEREKPSWLGMCGIHWGVL